MQDVLGSKIKVSSTETQRNDKGMTMGKRRKGVGWLAMALLIFITLNSCVNTIQLGLLVTALESPMCQTIVDKNGDYNGEG